MKRMLKEGNDLAEEIGASCYEKFNRLSPRGKPPANEWTHLAAFICLDENNQITVLSLGTGTKCLGGSKEERGSAGCLLHDSHAEVIARRALIRFFYQEILDENNSILIKQEKNKFYLNKSVRVYLFVSSPPCGAAGFLSDPIKRPKFARKSLNSSGEELYLKAGKEYETTSLSCTNKINQWIYQGFISPVALFHKVQFASNRN